ncbi:MAG: DUF4292 domain-containing protein [Thermodesulfobacteriota bacterium]|jgi:hypothetical protein|nr:MAG: DUF4292 domain-containing protein [Thermodesulfobacteriota bacterium]
MNFKRFHCLVIVVGSLFLFSACPRPGPIIPPPRATKLSPEETLKAIKENFPGVVFLKSNFKARIEYPFEGRLKKHSFEGALLYRKATQALRLQSFGTFGNTIFDVLYQPDQATVYLPSSAVVYTGEPHQIINPRIPDFFFFLQEIMHGMEETYEGEPLWLDDETLKTKKGNLDYEFKINRRSLFIERKTVQRNGKTIAEIFYQDYKRFVGNVFPTVITAFFPSEKTTIKINLDSPVINKRLAENLFILSLPQKIRYLPLTKLNDFFLSDPS